MLDAVDLDRDRPSFPHDVEVVAAVTTAPNRLPTRLRQPTAPALASEVELSERTNPAHEIEQYGVDQSAPAIAANSEELGRERRRRRRLGATIRCWTAIVNSRVAWRSDRAHRAARIAAVSVP